MERYFAPVKSAVENNILVTLPQRASKASAGYDFYAQSEVTVPSIWPSIFRMLIGMKAVKPTIVWTGVKAKMRPNEVLELYNRSSNPTRLGLVMANGVGVIDSDYFGNPDNDGNIGFPFYNFAPWPVTINPGDRIGQGVFHTYLKVTNDSYTDRERTGGFGSTGE